MTWISVLMDNCSTMRGIRKGVESLIREKNRHLLDIIGDSVHMMSNVAKALMANIDVDVQVFVPTFTMMLRNRRRLERSCVISWLWWIQNALNSWLGQLAVASYRGKMWLLVWLKSSTMWQYIMQHSSVIRRKISTGKINMSY